MFKPTLLIAVSLLIGSQSALADTSAGKKLHNEKCTGCHMMKDHTSLYTRKDHKVNSIKSLGGMVSTCAQNLNVGWFPEEEKEVVDYLNETYYKFPSK